MKAVVLFNLGGPDNLSNVRPFLFNLFYDRSIIDLPNPLRFLLAKTIAYSRNMKAQKIYGLLGGGSPIVQETEMQVKALQKVLGNEYKVFLAMRYWHPMTEEVMKAISELNPSEIILVPLYPQYSLSTTESFFINWDHLVKKEGFHYPTERIHSYPTHKGYINAQIDVISSHIKQHSIPENARYLFSAHGLPEKYIRMGDPYEKQVDESVSEIVRQIPEIKDYVICYQSKVGPAKWLEPSSEDEIKRAACDGVPVVIVPISFVSENSETLYELDILYKEYAASLGLNSYYRIPTIQDNPNYIACLADMIKSGVYADQLGKAA